MSDAKRASSVEQCIDDITECSICNEVLQDNRCLPCLHTFCLKCLEIYKQGKSKGKTMLCPVCRRELPTPKSVADLPRNFFIDKLIDAHRRKQPDVPKICEICEGNKVVKATHYCCDCHQNLCQSCERQHKKIKATMTHKIVNSTRVTDTIRLSPRPTYCHDHTTKEAEVYCQICNMFICWQCKHVTHSSHTSVEIDCAVKDLATKLEKHIEQLSEHLGSKQSDIQKLSELEKFYTDDIDAESANICNEVSRLYRQINENGDKLKNTLTTATAVHLDAIREARSKIEIVVNELKKHKVYMEQIIHLGNVSDLWEYADKLISETARKVSAHTCEIVVPPVIHLSELDLQDLLIGRKTGIEQQYSNKDHLHDILHSNDYSKEQSPKERRNEKMAENPKHSQSIGNLENTEKRGSLRFWSLWRDNDKKLSSRSTFYVELDTREDKPKPEIEEEVSDNNDSDASKQDDKSGPCNATYIKPTSYVNVLPNNAQKTEELFSKYKSWKQVRTVGVEDGAVTVISGVTTLDSKLYCIFQHCNRISVYDSVMLALQSHVKVDGLVNPNDIASCKFNNCLYICDWGKASIFRVEVREGHKQTNWDIDKDLGGISVTAEHSILLAGHVSSKLKEYTSEGKLIRSINLDNGFKPWHAIRLASNDFLISQGNNLIEFHRVCLIGPNGKLKESFGGVSGSSEAHLCGPYHMAVDESGCILVNDCNNRRILLLSPSLKFIKELIPSSANVLRRARRMHLDEVAGRLYVADNETKDGKARDGRILVFSI